MATSKHPLGCACCAVPDVARFAEQLDAVGREGSKLTFPEHRPHSMFQVEGDHTPGYVLRSARRERVPDESPVTIRWSDITIVAPREFGYLPDAQRKAIVRELSERLEQMVRDALLNGK